jgi:hypothetical protein
MIGHATAGFALILSQVASQSTPPQRRCVTPEQAGAGAAVMLPEAVEMLRRGCERHLPEVAFLRTRGAELVQRWRSQSASHRGEAHAGLMRMVPPEAMAAMSRGGQGSQRAAQPGPAPAGAAPSPMTMIPEMLRGIEAGMAQRLNPEVCKEASRFVEALAPLPAGNVAQLVGATMALGLAVAPPKGDDGPPICRT